RVPGASQFETAMPALGFKAGINQASLLNQPPPRPEKRSLKRSERALDWLNFFVADVQTGFGPFVAVFLAFNGWPPGEIGLILSVGAVAAIASQMPGGALVDALATKRLLMGVALALMATSALIIAFCPRFWPVAVAEVLNGSAAGVLRV